MRFHSPIPVPPSAAQILAGHHMPLTLAQIRAAKGNAYQAHGLVVRLTWQASKR